MKDVVKEKELKINSRLTYQKTLRKIKLVLNI